MKESIGGISRKVNVGLIRVTCIIEKSNIQYYSKMFFNDRMKQVVCNN